MTWTQDDFTFTTTWSLPYRHQRGDILYTIRISWHCWTLRAANGSPENVNVRRGFLWVYNKVRQPSAICCMCGQFRGYIKTTHSLTHPLTRSLTRCLDQVWRQWPVLNFLYSLIRYRSSISVDLSYPQRCGRHYPDTASGYLGQVNVNMRVIIDLYGILTSYILCGDIKLYTIII